MSTDLGRSCALTKQLGPFGRADLVLRRPDQLRCAAIAVLGEPGGPVGAAYSGRTILLSGLAVKSAALATRRLSDRGPAPLYRLELVGGAARCYLHAGAAASNWIVGPLSKPGIQIEMDHSVAVSVDPADLRPRTQKGNHLIWLMRSFDIYGFAGKM